MMDANQKFWLSFWAILGCTACTIAVSIAAYNTLSWKYLTENGYEQQYKSVTATQLHGPVWVKPGGLESTP